MGGFDIELRLRATAPVVTGDGIELSIEPGGPPQRLALAPALAPGDTAVLTATLVGAAEHAEGDTLTLVIRSLAPALAEGALVLDVGEGGSTFAAHDMRIPSVADLRLQDAPLIEILVGSEVFGPGPGAVAHTYVVSHAGVAAPATSGTGPNGTYVILRGEETPDDAQAHTFPDRARRIAAAHTFLVDGQLARVHPGLAVVVKTRNASFQIVCVASCPGGAFAHTLGGASAPIPSERPSSLIPPPRDPRGIPVSEDEGPAEKTGIPLPPLVALGALAVAARWKRN